MRSTSRVDSDDQVRLFESTYRAANRVVEMVLRPELYVSETDDTSGDEDNILDAILSEKDTPSSKKEVRGAGAKVVSADEFRKELDTAEAELVKEAASKGRSSTRQLTAENVYTDPRWTTLGKRRESKQKAIHAKFAVRYRSTRGIDHEIDLDPSTNLEDPDLLYGHSGTTESQATEAFVPDENGQWCVREDEHGRPILDQHNKPVFVKVNNQDEEVMDVEEKCSKPPRVKARTNVPSKKQKKKQDTQGLHAQKKR